MKKERKTSMHLKVLRHVNRQLQTLRFHFLRSLPPFLTCIYTPSSSPSFNIFPFLFFFYIINKQILEESKMASRFGFQSSTMIVTNTPGADLALTNLAYCSPSDLHNFAVPGTKLFLALVADSFVLSLSYPLRIYTFISISILTAFVFSLI